MTHELNVLPELTLNAHPALRGQSMTLAQLIGATQGNAVIDGAAYDAPIGRELARGVITLLGNLNLISDVPERLERLETQGRKAAAQTSGTQAPASAVLARLTIDGGHNSVTFILDPLRGQSGLDSAEARLAALTSLLGGQSGYRPRLTAPVGVTELIVKQGHREILLTLAEDGSVQAEVLPYPEPEGGQRWTDDTGAEYLIVQGGQSAILLSQGTLHPLTGGAPEGLVRGTSFTLKGGN